MVCALDFRDVNSLNFKHETDNTLISVANHSILADIPLFVTALDITLT